MACPRRVPVLCRRLIFSFFRAFACAAVCLQPVVVMADAKAKGAEAVSVDKPKGPSVSYAAPVAEQKALAKGGNLEGALANLLQLEKTARLVSAELPPPTRACPPAAPHMCRCAMRSACGGGRRRSPPPPRYRARINPRARSSSSTTAGISLHAIDAPSFDRRALRRRAATSRGRPSWSSAWWRCATTRRTLRSSTRP